MTGGNMTGGNMSMPSGTTGDGGGGDDGDGVATVMETAGTEMVMDRTVRAERITRKYLF